MCLLAAPLVFSKLACLLSTSTQTDAVLSALGNSRGLWVFSEKPIAPHTASLVLCIQTHTYTHAHARMLGLLEKHICVLIFCADIHECCLICEKKKTLSLHIIGGPHIANLAVPNPLSDTISLLLGKSAFRRDQCYQSKLICFD